MPLSEQKATRLNQYVNIEACLIFVFNVYSIASNLNEIENKWQKNVEITYRNRFPINNILLRSVYYANYAKFHRNHTATQYVYRISS